MGHQVGAEHVVGVDAGLLGDVAEKRAGASPAPHTALTWRCGSSVSDLRSSARWMASCGTRRIGASTRTSRWAMPRHRRGPKPPADAEVAVQPGVQPCASVGLQRDHLPAYDLRSGCCLTRRLGLSVCAADDAERPPPASPPLSQATSDPARTVKNLPARGPAVGLGQSV